MDLVRLIELLSQPAVYPFPVKEVEVRHTHISVVFLAGPYAFKIKKPVSLGFLDFSTLDKRKRYCEEEVRLNRRLAPSVYLGVVPVARAGKKVMLEGEGEIIDWAVKMERLPENATLRERLIRAEIGKEFIETLARTIARFHAQAEAGERIAAFGRFDIVVGNTRENFDQAQGQVGVSLSKKVYQRLKILSEEILCGLRPLIDERAQRGVPRDTHGDLHLDHVYLFPERKSPADLVIIDCIEFNERFRFADPVSDMAFLNMDLKFHARRDLAQIFARAYFDESKDREGPSLLPFYTAYRAAVRGKVEGFELAEKEIPEQERTAALARARAHWLLALAELEEPERRPCLILVGGLPGTGKSTLVRALAETGHFCLIRSDVVRKELAGIPGEETRPSLKDQDIYTSTWNDRTYAECLRRAEQHLFEGNRVIVDASFVEEKRRQAFREAGHRWGVAPLFLQCRAEPELVRQRLLSRKGDASDADWSIYLQASRRWEAPGSDSSSWVREIDSGTDERSVLSQAVNALREFELSH